MSDFESDQFSFPNSQFSSERTRVWEFAGLLYRPVGFTVSDRGSPRMINENWELVRQAKLGASGRVKVPAE